MLVLSEWDFGGEEHKKNALYHSDIQAIAICDIDPNRLKVGQEMLKEK